MVKHCSKSRCQQQKTYGDSLLNTEQIVKKIKQNGDSHCPNAMEALSQKTAQIIKFMGQSLTYKKNQYSRSLVVLDNILVLKKDLILELQLNNQFIQNLSNFFVKVIVFQQNYSQKQQVNSKIQNILYGCLYLMLLLIYKAGSDQALKIKLISRLFTLKLVDSFTKISISNCSSKMLRVIAMILGFLLKNNCFKNNRQIAERIKMMTLELVYQCEQQGTKTYLCVALKYIISSLKMTEIYKYKIINFVMSCLQITQVQTVKNCLLIIYFILQHYPNFTETLIRMRLMKYWDQNISAHPSICLNIFKLVLPHFSVHKKQTWIDTYINFVLETKNKISFIHLDIIQYLVKQISQNKCLAILQNGYLNQIRERRKSQGIKMYKSMNELTSSFHERIKEIDGKLFSIYENLANQNFDNGIDNLY